MILKSTNPKQESCKKQFLCYIRKKLEYTSYKKRKFKSFSQSFFTGKAADFPVITNQKRGVHNAAMCM